MGLYLIRRMLNGLYLCLLAVVLPVMLYRRWRHGKYRDGWAAKLLGRVPRRTTEKQCLWLHAVSVGEVLQLQPIVAGWQQAHPDWQIVISTTTATGHAVAIKQYPGCTICYCPLDFTWAVSEAFERIRPTCLALVELELWPNLILEAKRRNIATVLINGRLGKKSFRGYRRWQFVLQPIWNSFAVVAAQNGEYANRFVQLGVPKQRVLVAGSIKFDRLQTDRDAPAVTQLRQEFRLNPEQPVLMAGSTHEPEEQIVLAAWKALRRSHPELQLIMAPRHAERFNAVAELITAQDFQVARRSDAASAPSPSNDRPRVFLLDTLGELASCWGLADIAYVGGSLNQRGGQNMMEPAAYGAAVLFGPNTWNFAEVVAQLKRNDACREINDEQQLSDTVLQLLTAPQIRTQMGQRAQAYVMSQQGGTAITLAALERQLFDTPPVLQTRAA